jgi:hypothetical protein
MRSRWIVAGNWNSKINSRNSFINRSIRQSLEIMVMALTRLLAVAGSWKSPSDRFLDYNNSSRTVVLGADPHLLKEMRSLCGRQPEIALAFIFLFACTVQSRCRARRSLPRNVLWKRSHPNCGEKSVRVKNVESIFSTNFPFSSDFAFTLFHSGSSWKAFQFAAAASRLGCSRM